MRDQLVEAIADEAIRQRQLESGFLELEKEALLKVTRGNARRIEALDCPQHLLGFFDRVQRKVVDFPFRILGRTRDNFVERRDDILNRGSEIAIIGDVADELVGKQHLAGRQLEEAHLVAQVVTQIARRDGHRLEVFALFMLLASAADGVKAVEKNFLPVDLIASLLRFGLLGVLGLRLVFLFLLFLDEVEERIVQQLLLEVLLQIEERHVEEIHRLVQAGIDLELLPKLR